MNPNKYVYFTHKEWESLEMYAKTYCDSSTDN